MKITTPRFIGKAGLVGLDSYVYHIGSPADGDGCVLRYYWRTRIFSMRARDWESVDGWRIATPEELAEAIALMPPEEIARCVAASLTT